MGRDSKILNRGIELLEQRGGSIGSTLLRGLLKVKAESKIYRWPKLRSSLIKDPEESRAAALSAIFGLLGELCLLRESSLRDELPRAQLFARQAFGLGPDDELAALHSFRSARTAEEDIADAAARFMRLFADAPEMRLHMLDALFYFAVKDGEIPATQVAALRRVIEIFELPDEALDEVRRRHEEVDQTRIQLEALEASTRRTSDGPTLRERIRDEKLAPVDRAYILLGCSKIDSPEKIRETFRALVYRVHPDRVAAAGEAAERVEAAREKFKEILAAYSLIRRDKDF